MENKLPTTKINCHTYFDNRTLIDEMIEKFGPEQVMMRLYEREDFVIPNWYDYTQIAYMWGKTEESVIENWEEIQYMIKKVVEQGGFDDVLEQQHLLEDWEINLVKSE